MLQFIELAFRLKLLAKAHACELGPLAEEDLGVFRPVCFRHGDLCTRFLQTYRNWSDRHDLIGQDLRATLTVQDLDGSEPRSGCLYAQAPSWPLADEVFTTGTRRHNHIDLTKII